MTKINLIGTIKHLECNAEFIPNDSGIFVCRECGDSIIIELEIRGEKEVVRD